VKNYAILKVFDVQHPEENLLTRENIPVNVPISTKVVGAFGKCKKSDFSTAININFNEMSTFFSIISIHFKTMNYDILLHCVSKKSM